jgi:membrane protein DedA with SNARE-associated domain
VAKMPFMRFTVLTIAGCLPWVLGLALAGQAVGSEWTSVRKDFQYVDYVVIVAIVVAVVYAVVRRRAGNSTGPGPTEVPPGSGAATDAG